MGNGEQGRSVGQTNVLILVAITITGIIPGLVISECTLAVTDTGSGGVGYYADETEKGEYALNDLNGEVVHVLLADGIALLDGGDNSRFDFYLERGKTLDRGGTIEQGGEKYLIEVKGCTLAGSELGFGLFPDAPTERGVKHLNELAEAAGQGYHCAIVFVIQMNGIHHVDPNDATQPEFREALEHAVKAGVHVICQSCCVDADRIWICGAADDTARLKG